MKTRALVIAALAVAAVAFWFTRSVAPAANAPALQSAGAERTWRLTLRAHAELPALDPRVPPAPSDLTTTGVLRLRGYAPGKVGLSLASLDEVSMTMFGAPAMQDRAALTAALTGGEAVLTLRAEGDLADVDFTPGSHNVFRSFAQTVAGELQLPLREGERWTLLDTTLRGKAEAVYERTAGGFRRTRVRYAKLSAFGQGLRDVTVAAQTDFVMGAGGLRSVRSRETLEGTSPTGQRVVSTLELDLEPLDTRPLATTLPAQLDDSRPGELDRPSDWKEQMLAQRVDGLTPQQLVDGMAVHGAGASPQAVARFLPRASGLLLQQPELCAQLAVRAKAPQTAPSERVFTLEVLAAAGSPEAQAAMRDVLDSPALRAEPEWRERFQRLSLLQRPTAETVAFVGEAWQRSTARDRHTLSLVVGATAGMLSRSGGEAEGARWVARLSDALHASRDAVERRYLVGALGNAGLVQAVPDVLAALREPDVELRSEAVDALRKTPVPEARRAVTLALQDAAPAVRAQAVEVLHRWKPDAAERAALIAGMRAGTLSLSLGHQVVNALEPSARDPEVRALLQWLAAQPAADPSLQRRARALAGGAQ